TRERRFRPEFASNDAHAVEQILRAVRPPTRAQRETVRSESDDECADRSAGTVIDLQIRFFALRIGNQHRAEYFGQGNAEAVDLPVFYEKIASRQSELDAIQRARTLGESRKTALDIDRRFDHDLAALVEPFTGSDGRSPGIGSRRAKTSWARASLV